VALNASLNPSIIIFISWLSYLEIEIILMTISQARSSLYANTQLRAHRRAENNKEQKNKINKE
jgi:hypothetical protein